MPSPTPISRLQRPLLQLLSAMALALGATGLLPAAEKAGEKSLFNGKDLTGWRQPTGEWKTVGAVSLNPEDNRQLKIAPGTGAMVNNPKGKTVNLLSELEHGD